MEDLAVLAVVIALAILGGSICGIVAVVKVVGLDKLIAGLRRQIDMLRQRLVDLEKSLKHVLGEEGAEEVPAPADREGIVADGALKQPIFRRTTAESPGRTGFCRSHK